MRRGLVAGLVLVSCLSGCGGAPRDKIDASRLANDMEHIMNLRYTGYKDTDKEILNRVFEDNIVREIEDRFKSGESTFIDLEDTIKRMENDIVLEEDGLGGVVESNLNTGYTDERIIKNEDGHRGVRVEDVYIEDGRFSIEIMGNMITIDIPEGIELSSYNGNPSYKLDLMEYNLYDDGTFIISLGTDLEGAFKDRFGGLKVVPDGEEQELSGDMSSLDGTKETKVNEETYSNIYNTFMYENESYERKLAMKVGKDGKISEIDIDNILGELRDNE